MMLSERGRVSVSAMPRDRVLPETDGPFGQQNGLPLYPWQAMQVAHPLAAIWNVPTEVATAQLRSNFRELSKASRELLDTKAVG